jgi:alkylation response protein AidB-like acyl-CoA dehydrogenase
VLVCCRTSPAAKHADATREDRRGGITILVVDAASEGYAVGRKLDKLGLRASDTGELSFTDVLVPVEDRLGEEGRAFEYLTHNLPQERLGIALYAYAQAAASIRFAIGYVRDRTVFGRQVASFQNTKFVLADCQSEVDAMQAVIDRALDAHDAGDFTPADAASVKLFVTERAGVVIDKCLQLHGGYGYMREYPISRMYADTRVTRIYGGTSEVMRTIVAKSIGL